MNKLIKNISLVILLFLIISGILVLYSAPTQKPVEVSLNGLVNQINAGEVKQITVDSDQLTIMLNNGTQEKAIKEAGSSLTDTLNNYGTDKGKLQQVTLDVKNPSSFSVLAGTILPFLLPFLLIGAFIWFMMRQAQRGNAQALSFGMSRARMVDPKDKKKRVTFLDVAGAKEAKEELCEIVEFLKHPKKFLGIGAKIPKGVLLFDYHWYW